MMDGIDTAKNWSSNGKKFYDIHDYEMAIECYNRVAILDPCDADNFYNWGMALSYLALERRDESLLRDAAKKYDEVVRLNPAHRSVIYLPGLKFAGSAELKQDASLFEKAIEKYAEAATSEPNNDRVFSLWGNAVLDLAELTQDESLFEVAAKKYAKAIDLNPACSASALNNWGNACLGLARIKSDASLFKDAFEKYEEAVCSNENHPYAFNRWGAALIDFAKIEPDEKAFRESFSKFYEKSNCLKKLNKSILEIIVLFHDTKYHKLLNDDMLYRLLEPDMKTADSIFFKEVTAGTIKDKDVLEKYKMAYICSIKIISQLHISFKDDELLVHYTNKMVLQKILLNKLKFWLNDIDYSNDPDEGKSLLRYLFENNDSGLPVRRDLNNGYGAFVGSFTFNHDSLNQFRLYGKEEKNEGTGISLVFRDSFFNEEAKMAIIQSNISNGDLLKSEEEKLAIFRCIYIDPITQRVKTVGHKDDYLFSRGTVAGESNNDIKKKIEDYKEVIDKITASVNREMDALKILVQGLEPKIVGQLLIHLRYLVKHVAFKEEQECRIIKILRLDHESVHIDDKSRRIYIDYKPEFSKHIRKIYFGPKATEMELFQDFLTNKGINILCERSENTLA
jgi:tetratricopeptide (TPR) repeat protein